MGDDRGRRRGPGSSSPGRRATGSSVLTPPTGVPVVPPDPGHRLDAGPPPRTAPDPPVTPVPPVADAVASPCRCGHSSDAHRHWRRGSDCGQCGADTCAAYRSVDGVVRRLLRSMGLVG
jgi:hypothetical protein